MRVLLTGAAGFIGYHTAERLLAEGHSVLGVDNRAPYYAVALKDARLSRLQARNGFTFREMDIASPAFVEDLKGEAFDRVIHLAAQPGVRHSLKAPFDYLHSNLEGHLRVLELCRALKGLGHLVYASSSSVYGGNTKLPFSESDPVDHPVSLYAATKKADELLSHAYSHLYGIPATGLRFFTVYGPWGRPDMSPWLFAEAMLAGRPITLFNHGRLQRDYTYIDDIVEGIMGALRTLPKPDVTGALHTVYNLGHNQPVMVPEFLAVLEDALGCKAEIRYTEAQPGDVEATYADIAKAQQDFGFMPGTPLSTGVARFAQWFKEYHQGV